LKFRPAHVCRWAHIPCKNRPTGANGSYTRPKLGHSSAVIAISRMPASRRRNSKPRRRQRQALSVGGTPSVTDRMLGSWSRGDIKERRQQYEKSPQFQDDLAKREGSRARRRTKLAGAASGTSRKSSSRDSGEMANHCEQPMPWVFSEATAGKEPSAIGLALSRGLQGLGGK
jgi:hypothetical protein